MLKGQNRRFKMSLSSGEIEPRNSTDGKAKSVIGSDTDKKAGSDC